MMQGVLMFIPPPPDPDYHTHENTAFKSSGRIPKVCLETYWRYKCQVKKHFRFRDLDIVFL